MVLVTARESDDGLMNQLSARHSDWETAGIKTVELLGDAKAPAPIAWAVFSGHRYARELQTVKNESVLPFKRELASLGEF